MKHQKGFTLVSMLMMATVVIICGVVIMRVIPVYMQHYSVMSSVKSLKNLPASDFGMTPQLDALRLKKRLQKQLYVNQVDDIVNDGIKINPLGKNRYSILVKYDVTRPLVMNVSLLFSFDDKVEVTIRGS